MNYASATACPAGTPAVYNLFVNPPPNAAGAVTGTAALCAGTSGVAYSCAEILNAASYTWTLPPGAAIAVGAGTRNILVDFGPAAVSGNIMVSGTNNCGNGMPSPPFALTVSPLPAPAGIITGPASVCAFSTGNVYSVPPIANATAYTWLIPPGVTITSGVYTNSIVVTFGPPTGFGSLAVMGTNSCGNGTVSPGFVFDLNPVPGAPVITATGNVLTSSSPAGNQWYYEGTAIAGATGRTYMVTSNTGYYWCKVTLLGCTSPVSNKVWVVVTGGQELQSADFRVYPVPCDGRFTVSVSTPVQETFTIMVYNQLGEKRYESGEVMVNGTIEKQIDLRPVPCGIYSVVLLNSQYRVVKKVLVRK